MQSEHRDSSGTVTTTYASLADGYEQEHGGSFTLLNGQTQSYYYEPVMRTPISMSVGQTYSQTITQHWQSPGMGTPDPFTRTVRYEGWETVTVPAGTFQTCRVRSAYSGSVSMVNWIVASGPYTGLLVKTLEYNPDGSLSRTREATALTADWK